tara:strand:- start:55 stop:786 length:732 start_codon:yes stop_codon:yes gene_type:complete
MSQLLVDDIVNKDDSGAPGFSKGVTVTGVTTSTSAIVGAAVTINSTGIDIASGIVTATTFKGDLDGNATSATNASGLSGTPNIVVGSVTASSGSVSGNFNVGGTLTYEDVTNIDSVGLITARNGIDVLAGISTFQGVDNEKRVTEKINTISGTAIDCAEGNYFKKTVTGATAFTFTNVPTGTAYFLTIEIECNGSNGVNWPTSVKWPADTPPTITDGKTTLFMFVTDDGGTRWRGSSLADYTN